MLEKNPVLESFIKRYTDKAYKYPVLVRHQGTVIAFAMDNQRKIYYSVLNLNAQKDNSLDVNFWSEQPQELEFPKEIAEVGFGVADQRLLPTVKKGSRDPVAPGTILAANEEDTFLSRTARLTADAPFQVMSDGRCIYVFRQAIPKGHPDEVTVIGPEDKDVPIVDSTLLVDRFVLSGASITAASPDAAAPDPQLKLKMEVRFRRSRSKTRPQSTKDSLGARDMEDQPFFEPTQEISFINNLQDGRFSVLLLPTSVPEVLRWQIFAYNSQTQMIDAYNVERSQEGLFNTRGTQAASSSGSAETALHFQQREDHIALGAGVKLGHQFSQEAWILPAVTVQEPGKELAQLLLGGSSKTPDAPPSIWIVNNRRVRIGYGDGQAFHSFLTGDVLRSNEWNHLAVVLSDKGGKPEYHLYVNGIAKDLRLETQTLLKQPIDAPVTQIGAPGQSFIGQIDELRLWNRARTESEIRRDKNLRLTGQEPGLLAYYRMDEGSGSQIFDQTGNHDPAAVHISEPAWVLSGAPIGENAGVNRDSFRFEGRRVATGIASLLYFQQEAARTGYDQQAKPVKQGARVMLAVGTQADSSGLREIAALDFGVGANGRLAKTPDHLQLKPVEEVKDGQAINVEAELNRIKALQDAISGRTRTIVNLTNDINYLNRIHTLLDDAIRGRRVVTTVPTGSFDNDDLPTKLTRLQALRRLVANGQSEIDQLKDRLNTAQIEVFEHSNFGGRVLSFGRGFVGYGTLNHHRFNDLISSIRLPNLLTDGTVLPILEVTVYEHFNQNDRGRENGFAEDILSTTRNVGNKLNDRISSMVIREHRDFAIHRAAKDESFKQAQGNLDRLLNELRGILGRVQSTRLGKEQERTQLEQLNAQDEVTLQGLQALLNQGFSVAMGTVHTDVNGLSIAGGLLKFAWTADTPLLFDSATGNLALYFRGMDDQFFVTYYHTLTQRAEYPLTDDSTARTVTAFARSTEPEMDRIQIEIADSEGGDAATCTVTLRLPIGDQGSPTAQQIIETWRRVPRDPEAFTRVLNGLAGNRTFVGKATYTRPPAAVTPAEVAAEPTEVDPRATADRLVVAEGIQQSLPKNATLFLGDVKVTLMEAASRGATTVFLSGSIADPPEGELPIFFLEYDYALQADTSQNGVDLENGSRLLAFLKAPVGNAVKNQTSSSGDTLSCRWIAAAPGHTLSFDGSTARAELQANTPTRLTTQLKKLSPQSDLTMEAWARPNQINTSTKRARVLHYQPPTAAETGYLLGLKAETRETAIALNGTTDVVRIANATPLNFAGVITLEAWIMATKTTGIQNILAHGFGGSPNREVFLRINDGQYQVGAFDNGVTHFAAAAVRTGDAAGETWVHLAGVYEGQRWQLYRNGELLATSAETSVGAIQVNSGWAVGGHPNRAERFFAGQIAEPRIWKRARTAADIAADMNRELVGNETDLVGYWRFDDFNNRRATDHSRYDNHGTLNGSPSAVASPIPAYSVFAGVGSQMVQAAEIISGGNWNHLSAVFNQSYGVEFPGQDNAFVDAGKDVTLDVNRDLAIEVFFQVSDLSQRRALVTKGKISASENPEQYVPYALYLNPSGRLVFAFEDVKGKKHLFISEPIPQPTEFHKVTVSRKRNIITNPVRNSDNQQIGVDVVSWDAIQFFVDDEATAPNGKPYGSFEYKKEGSNTSGNVRQASTANGTGSSTAGFNEGQPQQPLDIGSSNAPLEFGSGFSLATFQPNGDDLDSINGVYITRFAVTFDDRGFANPRQAEMVALAGDIVATAQQLERNSALRSQVERVFNNGFAIAPLQGILTEIRLWNTPLEVGNLKPELQGNEKGLLSWWRFEEAEGTIAFDAKSNNHAKLKGRVTWAKDPNPNGSKLLLYRNGQLLTTTPVALSNRTAFQSNEPQFTLGGIQRGGFKDPFQGDLEEVRVWRRARTQEQIQDNLFRRLMGEQEQFLDNREDLLAYYPFDTDKAGTLSDYSLQGLHLVTTSTRFVLSSAPIGDDTPQVRSALAGLRTPFNGLLQSVPAVQEYGDLQTDIDGNLFGVFKRCYGLIENGEWQLITGFKVGDLVTEWVGQVQFDPQIIGYIEGAPPVPGENLTSTGVVLGEFADYNGASAVTLKQADKTTFTYAANRDSGFDMTVDLAIGALTSISTSAGLGFETTVADADGAFGGKTKFEHSLGWLEGGSTATAISTSLSSQQQLQGFVEPPNQVAFEDVGRRFIPENMGFALVQSQTADVFALRLKHNSALVSYQMRPNPDIPPDRNIINFPLNPSYTKQGTLDGKIGFNPDPAYPNALTYSNDSSFYKPVEAFALKQRIQREEERIKAYYEQYDAGSVGRRQNATHFQPGDLGAGSIVAQLPKLSKRNLANTYVWTADGGLFAETQETLDVIQETSGGSYSFKGLAGGFADLSLAIGGAGIKFELEMMFGGHLNLQATKSQESETGFSLDVNVDKVERDVFLRDAAGDVLFDHSNPLTPKALRHPGRVDAYRFMSFYLEPQPDHFDLFFDRVVDPLWLEQSGDANAIALRGLRDTHKNSQSKPPCWRIMHRVTFVSRVLPPVGSQKPLPALESKMRELSIDSNFELIKRLDPFVADKVDDFGQFSRAVEDAIATYLPELQEHLATITEFMLLYYGVVETVSIGDSPELTGLLEAGDRAPNQPPQVDAGRDRTLQLVNNTVQIQLQGAVADDRLSPEAIFVTWSVAKAPEGAAVEFVSPHSLTTTAKFNKIGRYTLQLSASDGTLTGTGEMSILVNQAPIVSAGDSREVGFREEVNLQGKLLRDGRGERTGQALVTRWESISGPGQVTFESRGSLPADAQSSLNPRVRFSKSGVYLLRLTAETTTANGILTHSDDVQIFVGGRVSRGLQALYSFADEGNQIRDVAGMGSPAHLTVEGATQELKSQGSPLPHARSLAEPARLTSRNVSRLIEAIKASQELTLEAWINPAATAQSGLARILTLSGGAGQHNFVLGQAGNQYYVGIRTSETNANGSDRAFVGGSVSANSLTHLVCTRDANGLTRLYVNNREVAQRHISGSFAPWDERFALVLGNDLGDSLVHDRAWAGAFHLVALYSRALSPVEVRTNFEIGADANLAPVLSAGTDRVINLPETLTLKGTATDDRLLTEQITVLWSQPAGPAPVTFDAPESLETTVTFVSPGSLDEDGNPFPVSGIYTLRLTVQDDEQAVSDEVQIIVNHAPTITLPEALLVNLPQRAQLTAQVQSGLGDPGQGRLALQWSKLSGPGSVTFSDATLLNPTAEFSESGTYRLRLTAGNGLLSSQQEMTVHVNKAPVLRLNAPSLVNLPGSANLEGEITDNGLADPKGTVKITWSQVRGPVEADFADPAAATTTARFSASGEYTLRLTVSTGALSTHKDVTLTVNQAPAVAAGPDQLIDLPNRVELDGLVSDDGFPTSPGRLTLTWSQVSGPGTTSFSDRHSSFTTAQFSQGGTYVLRLTADDGAIASHDDVTIQVNQPPTVDAGADQFLTLPLTETSGAAQRVTTTLVGTTQDDGLPTGATLTHRWQQVSGPSPVQLETPNDRTTLAHFDQAGTYVLELSASDGRLTSRDQVTVVLSERVTAGLQAFYSFREGTGNTIRDLAGVEPPLDMVLQNGAIERLPQGKGIALRGNSLIATPGAATRLNRAIKASQALTVEAWIKPTTTQVAPDRNPARIVTLSQGTGDRNFTLGQTTSNRYVMRLRTETTGSNGDNPVVEAGSVVANQLTHLVYTRDASGNATLYINGQPTSRTISGNLASWSNDFRLALGNETSGDRPWQGEYHLVAIYDRALQATEVSQNFAAGC
jgi:PKD repeat protein